MRHILSWKIQLAGLLAGGLIALMYFGSVSCQVRSPQNLRVLKDQDMSIAEIKEYMRNFTLGLGVECEYCHNKDDYASDEKNEKLISREMLKMMAGLNESAVFKSAKKEITCYTCHRGTVEINGIPPGL